jgi:hypothetical protein
VLKGPPGHYQYCGNPILKAQLTDFADRGQNRGTKALPATVSVRIVVSTIQLSQDIQVDPLQIASAKLDKKGSKISSGAITVSSEGSQDLQVPDDSLIVKLEDGSEFVIRGEKEAKAAWDLLNEIKIKEKLSFQLE